MPDWDSRIIAMAGDYETSDEDVVRIEDKNVIDGTLKTSGNVVISDTTFDGNCYIIADGNITYNVNDFKSSGRVILYSRNGKITVNGTNIDINGIMYAPKGTVTFNSNISNINGRIFADRINFSGSIFNVNGSDSDWELLGSKAVIAKTYTFNDDFNEGDFDGLGLDIADELTLEQRTDSVTTSAENEYKDDEAANGIALNVKTDKSVLTGDKETVNTEFDLNGFSSQEVEENNVDLAIVADTSGSMEISRRNNAVSATKEVVSKMKPGDKCAIIKFTTSATVLQGFTYDTELLNTAIDKLNASIASGINKVAELFNGSDSTSKQKYIILMSDSEDSSASAKAASDAYDQLVVNYFIPRVIMLGETGDFTFVSDSDAEVTVKVNGEAVQLDADGKFSYTPDAVGDLTIDIHATNGGNTDTDFTLTVPVVKVELISEKTVYSDTCHD